MKRIDGVERIREIANDLEPEKLEYLCEQLRVLRHFIHDFEYELDNRLRIQHENKAEAKAKKLFDSGFVFDRITIDNVPFFIKDGKVLKGYPSDDEIPF